jgi:CBS domain-containing protein
MLLRPFYLASNRHLWMGFCGWLVLNKCFSYLGVLHMCLEVRFMAGVVPVRDIMSGDVKTTHTDSTVLDVVRKMNRFDVGALVVVDSAMRPVGIVTERDVLRKVVESGLPVDVVKVLEVMSSPLVTVEPDLSVERVAKLMSRKKIKKLPVVTGGKLVGIVTSMDLVRSEPRLIAELGDLICPYYPAKKSK